MKEEEGQNRSPPRVPPRPHIDLPPYQERDPYPITGYSDIPVDVPMEGMVQPTQYPQLQQPEMVQVGAAGGGPQMNLQMDPCQIDQETEGPLEDPLEEMMIIEMILNIPQVEDHQEEDPLDPQEETLEEDPLDKMDEMVEEVRPGPPGRDNHDGEDGQPGRDG